MNVAAVLRLSGTDEALAFLIHRLDLEANNQWTKGEPDFRGIPFSHTGLNATITDAADSVEMMLELREFLAWCEEQDVAFSNPAVSAEIDIAVMVGGSKQFTASLEVSPLDMLRLGSLGLTLKFSAYPCSDEASETDESA